MEAGKIRTIVDRVFPLEQAAEAHRYAESGARRGAVVISLGSLAAQSVFGNHDLGRIVHPSWPSR